MDRDAASLEAFLANPEGTFVRGDHHLCGCVDARLYVTFFWGEPSRKEVLEAVRAFAVEVRDCAEPHVSYFDCSALTGIDPDAFRAMHAYWSGIADRQRRLVERQALVRPDGFAGVVVAGFFRVFAPPYPARVFSDGTAALRWLGRDPGLLDSWRRARAAAQELSPDLLTVRELIAGDPTIEFGAAARRLGCSMRTLQRRLRASGTSFHRERDRVRLEAATRLIRDTGHKLAAIAAELGFSSPQHFSEWFRRCTGESPSELRR
jgi:AraC-like DNA-binding protein